MVLKSLHDVVSHVSKYTDNSGYMEKNICGFPCVQGLVPILSQGPPPAQPGEVTTVPSAKRARTVPAATPESFTWWYVSHWVASASAGISSAVAM